MKLIDTHSHLYAEEFDDDRQEALARAREGGVVRLLLPAIDKESNERLFDLCRACGDYVVPLMGLHPTSVNDNPRWHEELAEVEHLLTNPPQGIERFYGVGEIGLDLYWSRDWEAEQVEAFRAQLDMAVAHNLPVVIHTRDADDATLGVLDEADFHNGIIHCFTGSVPFEKKLLDRGFMISISGIVTFRAAENVRDAARYVPDDRLLVETDSPFLAPVPVRGKENEPSFLKYTLEFLANLRNVKPEILASLTTDNARSFLKC